MTTTSDTNSNPSPKLAWMIHNEAREILDYWQQAYDQAKQAFESEAKTYGYLTAGGRFGDVLQAEAMLELIQDVAHDAATPEARTRLRDRRERYIDQVLRLVGDDVGQVTQMRARALKRTVHYIDHLLAPMNTKGIKDAL